ncbi:MAG: hypothetical protein PVF73_03305 [Bacteroidales bacterium]|jgi:hypothetical protein
MKKEYILKSSNSHNEKNILVPALSLFCIILIILSFFSRGSAAGADDINHYLFARWSYKHPEFLLHHWAKPFFTLITSAFAQFGHMGVKIMNIILGILTGYITKKICDKLSIRNSYLVLFFVFFMPIYLVMLLSGNNEIMTSFFIILGVFFFLDEKYILAALSYSVLPLIRNETIILFPFLILAMIIRRKYYALPFFMTGLLIYSFAGWFYYHDFFWLITKMAYTSKAEYLGHGDSLFYFTIKYYLIFGIPIAFILVTGITLQIINLIRFRSITWKSELIQSLLIMIPMITFFYAHSYVWWKGIGNSGGRIRVMSCIIPLAAIVSLRGFNLIAESLKKIIRIKGILYTIAILFFGYVLYYPFVIHNIPVPEDQSVNYLRETYTYLEKNNYLSDRSIYLQDPRFFKYFKDDPYAPGGAVMYIPAKTPETRLKDGDLILYDIHFAFYETGIPIDSLMNSKYFKLIHIVNSDQPMSIFGSEGLKTYIYIFQRTKYETDNNNYATYNQLMNINLSRLSLIKSLNLKKPDHKIINTGKTEPLNSNYNYYAINEEFSPTLKLSHEDLHPYNSMQYFAACSLINSDSMPPDKLYLVCSVETKYSRKTHQYISKDLSACFHDCDTINILQQITLAKELKRNQILKIYIWNPGMHSFSIGKLGLYHEVLQ